MLVKAGAAVTAVVAGIVIGAGGYAMLADDETRPVDVIAVDADVIVFLDRAATYDTWRTLRMDLEDDDRVASLDYVDRDESLAEFREMFRDDDEMLERADRTPDVIPPSYRLKLTAAGRDQLDETAAEFDEMYGVMRAVVVFDCDDLDSADYDAEKVDVPRCRR